ncbi:MAG: tetratricopeptide repeat protein, partial [bacterium]
NMLPETNGHEDISIPDLENKFLTIEEENHLWQTSNNHPDARINDLMELLGDRYTSMGHERLRYYLTTDNKHILPTNGQHDIEKPKKRFESVEKFFQRQLLEAFPIRQLLYRKYEFRGNTNVISRALDHYQNGKFQDSLQEFSKIRKVIAESESVYCFFGNLYLLLNMSIKARQEYLKALKINPKSVHAYLALGYIALLHEDYDGTIHYLTTAMRLEGDIDPYQRFLGQFVSALDNKSGNQEWIV